MVRISTIFLKRLGAPFTTAALAMALAPLASVRALGATTSTAPPATNAPAPPLRSKLPSYYVEPRSYGTRRDLDPPRYVQPGPKTGIDSLKSTPWLDLGLDYRLRYEYRDQDIRRPEQRLDQPFLQRTRAYLGFHDILDPFRAAVELGDSRIFNHHFPSDSREVNELDLVQLWGELHFKNLLPADPLGTPRPLFLRGGRMAFEFLDRRLLANNQWRNTPNTFQGARATVGQDANDWSVDLLAVQPLERFQQNFDQPRPGQWLYGAIGHWRRWSDVITLEPYSLSLIQHRQPNVAPREIHSAALRGYGIIGTTGFDYDFDVMGQWGEDGSRDHRAYAWTLEGGYTFDATGKPRASLSHGYASGDRDPSDAHNQRFERFFGFARPWSANDYIVWENINAPKARLEFQLHPKIRADAGYSLYWLASDTDRFANANLRDPSGQSGDFIGHEADARVRFTPWRRVECIVGYAHLWPGEFLKNNGKGRATDFAYIELTLSAF